MRIRIRNKKQLALFTACITVGSIVVSEAIIVGYLSTLDSEFVTVQAVLWLGALVPFIVATPAALLMAAMGYDLSKTERELTIQAETDALTGLVNRRSFLNHCDSVLDDARDSGTHVALLVLDADHFKQINDQFGHAMGDAALKTIAEQLLASFRRSDCVCRLGGEEFAVLLPDTDAKAARALAERAVERIGVTPISGTGCVIETTISCGYADTHVGYGRDTLLRAADSALYAAKAAGRNRALPFVEPDPSGRHAEQAQPSRPHAAAAPGVA